MIRGLAFSTLLLLLSIAASAQSGHTIRGKVRSLSGTGIGQVLVALESGNGALISQVTTNSEGDFYFASLTESSYSVAISAPDYGPASQQVRFTKNLAAGDPGESQFVEIVLRPRLEKRSPPPTPVFAQDVPPAARKKYDEAVRLIKDKDTKKGLDALSDAIAIFPNYFDARVTLATELMKAGRLDEAIVNLEEARKVNARDARLYHVFGMVLTQRQMPWQAAQVFAEAARLNASDPQIQYLLATALIDSLGLIDQAKNDPSMQRSRILQDAEKALAAAFDLSGKKMFVVHLQMARVYEKKEQPDHAADELEKYLKSSPTDKNAAAIRTAIEKLRKRS